MGARSRARLVFAVDGVWRTAGERSTAELTGVVTEAGTDRRLPAAGTLTVRPGRVVHVELALRFGEGWITAVGEVDLVPLSPARLAGVAVDLLGQVVHQLTALGNVVVTGRMQGGTMQPEDVDVSVDLVRLLRAALRAMH